MPSNHVWREAWRSVRRNRTSFLMATSVQTVCLTLLSIFGLGTLNLSAVVRSARSGIEVHAFLADNADVAALEDRIRCVTGVTATRYVSKDEALLELKSEIGEDAATADVLAENPLPASIRVSLAPGYVTEAALADIEAKLALFPGITEVWSGRESLARLDRVLRTAIAVGIGLLIIVSLSVVFIVFQTVDSSISGRSREIEIMELVGAPLTMVRLPFMLEGAGQGLVAGIVSFLLVFLLARVVASVIPSPIVPVGLLAGFDVLLGGLLGLAGSVLALDRLRR